MGRRKAEKLVVEDKIDAHAGGYLSNVCLACMPVYEEHKLVNMITVCLDTTITTTKCSRYTFRPFDFAPAQAVAAAPYMVNKIGKKWHIAYADYAWGQSTKDAFAAEIKKNGGEVVGTTGIPLGTADMTAFLSKITGTLRRPVRDLLRAPGRGLRQPELRPRPQQEVQAGRRRGHRGGREPAAMGNKVEGFVGIDRYVPVLEGVLNTPHHKKFLDDAMARLKQIDPSGPLPDRYVQSNFEGVNALKVGMQKSGFRGREDTMKLIEALEGMEMKESEDFPQGDKTLRKEDHQAFVREFLFEVSGGKYRILEVIPKEKTLVPAACKFA